MSLRPAASAFHNLPASDLADLADLYGAIVAEMRGLELRRDAIKAALLKQASAGTEITGSAFRVTISSTTRWTGPGRLRIALAGRLGLRCLTARAGHFSTFAPIAVGHPDRLDLSQYLLG